jgi:hypothetical protein
MVAKAGSLRAKLILGLSFNVLLLVVYFTFFVEPGTPIGGALVMIALIAVTMEAADRVLCSDQESWIDWSRGSEFRACSVRFALLGGSCAGALEAARASSSIAWYSLAAATGIFSLANFMAAFRATK